MSGGTLNKELFLNTVKGDMANGTTNAVLVLKKYAPALSEGQCKDIIETVICAMDSKEADKVSIVATTPPSFAIRNFEKITFLNSGYSMM